MHSTALRLAACLAHPHTATTAIHPRRREFICSTIRWPYRSLRQDFRHTQRVFCMRLARQREAYAPSRALRIPSTCNWRMHRGRTQKDKDSYRIRACIICVNVTGSSLHTEFPIWTHACRNSPRTWKRNFRIRRCRTRWRPANLAVARRQLTNTTRRI